MRPESTEMGRVVRELPRLLCEAALSERSRIVNGLLLILFSPHFPPVFNDSGSVFQVFKENGK